MQKRFFVTTLAVAAMLTASAQVQRDEPPKPPPPPKPPVEKMQEIPPPPPPPAPPARTNGDLQLPDDFNAFMKRNPSVKGVEWKNNEIIILLKSGKEERYNLNDAISKKAALSKYGELPQAPPPPPPPPPPPAPPKPPKMRTLS